MRISVVNLDSRLSSEEVLTAIRAINTQIERDFEPYWHMSGELRLDSADPDFGPKELTGLRGDAVIYLSPAPDDALLGMHWNHSNGTPFGFVFTEVAARLHEPWQVTLSHEALELLADPECNLTCKGPHPNPDEDAREVFRWFEVCDPVQYEHYFIDGVPVSNFVLPLYFTGGEELDGRNDFLSRAGLAPRLSSFGIRPGGYVGFYDPLLGRDVQYRFDEPAYARAMVKDAYAGHTFRRADRRRLASPLASPEGQEGTASVAPSMWVEGIRVELAEGSRGEGDVALLEEIEAFCDTQAGSPGASTASFVDWSPAVVMVESLEFEGIDLGRLWQWCHDLVAKVDAVAHAEPCVEPYDSPEWEAAIGGSEVIRGKLRLKQKKSKSGKTKKKDKHENPTCGCDLGRAHHVKTKGDHEWALKLARVPEAWDYARAEGKTGLGEGIIIGHPDTGYSSYLRSHGRILRGGHDFVRKRRNDPLDPLPPPAWLLSYPGHGSRTGAVIVGPHGVGGEFGKVKGVAPGAKLLPFRISRTPILKRGKWLARAISRARMAKEPAHIISMSLGNSGGLGRELDVELEAAFQEDIILVAAVGNCLPKVQFPAAHQKVIAVAGVGAGEEPWCGSGRAKGKRRVDIAGPAESVWTVSAVREKGLAGHVVGRFNGTSYATAMTAGVAALWLDFHGRGELIAKCRKANPELRLTRLFQKVLRKTCRKPSGWSSKHEYGRGILNAEAVLKCDVDEVIESLRTATEPVRSKEERFEEDVLEASTLDVPLEEVRGRMAELLGVEVERLDQAIEDNYDELVMAFNLDPGLRAMVAGVSPSPAWNEGPRGRLKVGEVEGDSLARSGVWLTEGELKLGRARLGAMLSRNG